MIHRVSKYILIATILVQCIIHFGIPLMPHILNDPAWYFMFKHYLFKGIWIHEDLYPSFIQPVLYYCPLGYSLLHYISGGIAWIFDCSFADVLKHLQFIIYLFSGRLLWIIAKPYATSFQKNLLCLMYLWYLPFFNYAHLAMSETWFIACMLSSLYLFQLGITNQKTKWIAWGFILVGYTFLVRPVGGVMLPILLLLLLIQPHFSKKKTHIFIASLCFFVLPLIQSGFNKVVYNTWILREGFSWNLWNRVVNEDGYNPNLSEATDEMKVTLKDPNFVAKSEHWWDITSQLSNLGMQPKEIQAFCMRICFDGIKANPRTYFETSLKRGLWILPIEIQESICIYSTSNEYTEFLKNYMSRHHQPLLDELNKQEIGNTRISKFGIKLYDYWNWFFLKLNNQFLYIVIYVFILILGLIEIQLYIKHRKLDPIILSIILLPLAMSLAACSLEVLHNRYYLPGIVLEFMACCILLNKFNQFRFISSKN
jgi:hypothetical protein